MGFYISFFAFYRHLSYVAYVTAGRVPRYVTIVYARMLRVKYGVHAPRQMGARKSRARPNFLDGRRGRWRVSRGPCLFLVRMPPPPPPPPQRFFKHRFLPRVYEIYTHMYRIHTHMTTSTAIQPAFLIPSEAEHRRTREM